MLAPVSDSSLATSGGPTLATASYGSGSAPVAASGSFSGADVDGLDRVAAECRKGAQVCDEVRMVCEMIVAAASFFGPFGAAFIAYLKGVVIPWLKRISEALNLFARVLSAHSAAQRDASSAATSLPNYVTPDLPAANTHNYPTIPLTTGSGFAVSIDTPQGHAEVVYTPASVNPSTNPFTTSPLGTTTRPSTPAAISDSAAPIATTATGAGLPTSTPVDPVTPTGTGLGSPTVAPLDPVNAVATPDTQLGGGSGSGEGGSGLGGSSGSLGGGGMGGYGGGSGGGYGGGSGGLGSSGGFGSSGGGPGDIASVPATSTAATTQPSIGSANPSLGGACAPTDAAAGSSLADAPGSAGQASHDGLYSGLGQATGIGAGAAAVARSALTQARNNGGDSVIGTVLLPADGAADGAVQAQIFGGELG